MEKIYIQDSKTNRAYYLTGIRNISPNKTKTLTEYTTPEGTPLTDHAYANPTELNFELSVDKVHSKYNSYFIDESGNKRELDYDGLKTIINYWHDNSIRLSVQTNHELFKNMTIDSLSWAETDGTWNVFAPQLHFQEARTATLQMTTLDALNLSVDADYSLETSTGEDSGSSAATVGHGLAGAALGAAAGAAIGSIIPGIGTVAGAVVGGAIGFFAGLF